MTDRFPYRFDSEDILNGEIANCIASDLVEGSGKSCRVKIPTHILLNNRMTDFLEDESLLIKSQ